MADGVAIMVESYLRLGLNELADTSLALLKENYPDHISIDDEGDFRVRTEITDPSLLYTVSFGLLGDNRGNPPLARPSVQGPRAASKSSIPSEISNQTGGHF